MKLKKLKKETYVKIRNEAEFKALLQLAEDAGYRWGSGQKPTELVYENVTALCFYVDDKTLAYSSREHDNAISIKKVIKFEVGDKVKIREDLASCDNEWPNIIDEMKGMAGEILTVSSIYKFRSRDVKAYMFEYCPFRFIKKWIEPVFEIEEKEEEKFEQGKMYIFDRERYLENTHHYDADWAKGCYGKTVDVESERNGKIEYFNISPEWCIEVPSLKKGDFVKVMQIRDMDIIFQLVVMLKLFTCMAMATLIAKDIADTHVIQTVKPFILETSKNVNFI